MKAQIGRFTFLIFVPLAASVGLSAAAETVPASLSCGALVGASFSRPPFRLDLQFTSAGETLKASNSSPATGIRQTFDADLIGGAIRVVGNGRSPTGRTWTYDLRGTQSQPAALAGRIRVTQDGSYRSCSLEFHQSFEQIKAALGQNEVPKQSPVTSVSPSPAAVFEPKPVHPSAGFGWQVTLGKARAGYYCEAWIRDTNQATEGAYEIVIRPPNLIVVHEGPSFANAKSVLVSVDGETIAQAPITLQAPWPSHNAETKSGVIATIPDVDTLIARMERQDAKMLTVRVAEKSYMGTAQGFQSVSTMMGDCQRKKTSASQIAGQKAKISGAQKDGQAAPAPTPSTTAEAQAAKAVATATPTHESETPSKQNGSAQSRKAALAQAIALDPNHKCGDNPSDFCQTELTKECTPDGRGRCMAKMPNGLIFDAWSPPPDLAGALCTDHCAPSPVRPSPATVAISPATVSPDSLQQKPLPLRLQANWPCKAKLVVAVKDRCLLNGSVPFTGISPPQSFEDRVTQAGAEASQACQRPAADIERMGKQASASLRLSAEFLASERKQYVMQSFCEAAAYDLLIAAKLIDPVPEAGNFDEKSIELTPFHEKYFEDGNWQSGLFVQANGVCDASNIRTLVHGDQEDLITSDGRTAYTSTLKLFKSPDGRVWKPIGNDALQVLSKLPNGDVVTIDFKIKHIMQARDGQSEQWYRRFHGAPIGVLMRRCSLQQTNRANDSNTNKPASSSLPSIGSPATSNAQPTIDLATAGIAGTYCLSGRSVLGGVINGWRRNGIPISTARDAFDYMLEQNRDAWRVMIQSVTSLYSDPEGFSIALRNGSWDQRCLREVRGF